MPPEAPLLKNLRQPVESFLASLGASQSDACLPDGAIETGFSGLDKHLGGLRAGELVVVAGQDGIGASQLALWLALGCAGVRRSPGSGIEEAATLSQEASVGVALFSTYLNEAALTSSLLSFVSGVPPMEMERKDPCEAALSKLKTAGTTLKQSPLTIHTRPALSLEDIEESLEEADRALESPSVQVVVIDDYHGMHPGSSSSPSLAAALKRLAVQQGVAMILVAHTESPFKDRGREDREPRVCDLRSEWELRRAADGIALLYRDEYYFENTPCRELATLELVQHPRARHRKLSFRYSEGGMEISFELQTDCD